MTKLLILILFCLCLLSDEAFCQDIRPQIPQFEDPAYLIIREKEKLDDLLESAQQNVKKLMLLRDLIQKYQTLQEQYMLNPEDNETLYQMIKSAHFILDKIKEYHLTQLFEPAFLSELTIISKPAAKLGIPKP